MMSRADTHILIVTCVSQSGIVAAWSTCLFEADANIIEINQHADCETDQFFMRIAFTAYSLPPEAGLAKIGARFGATWRLHPAGGCPRVLIMVSKFDHCLADLLYRWRIGELAMEPVAIVSNHPRDAIRAVDIGDLPFHHLSVTRDTKLAQEEKLRALIDHARVDLVILARYMQVLSNDLSAWLSGRCINIHHSFLPSFKGSRPYHQAQARGVKIIGATAHYVTADLDEGPIIEQDVERISHADTPEDLVRKGRDVERRVLSNAVHYHLERRVILNGHRTVVFPD